MYLHTLHDLEGVSFIRNLMTRHDILTRDPPNEEIELG
jgi:hypothetical protein